MELDRTECRGDPEPEGKGMRGQTADRLNGDPRDLIPAMPTKGATPQGDS